jgi:2-dehydro-3-deoxyphosphogluconate aldolase/(4S)-4-hydroxy-2-oxoglutarate aldolase
MTNSIERAVTHLTSLGVRFDESTRKTDAKGVTKAIYLADEIAGFAIHLLQK